jgi:hypothetical protein
MATDFLRFKEGQDYLHTHGNGLPTTVYFLLSTKSCNGAGGSGTFTENDTLASTGVGEITGTGYARQSQAAPTPSGGLISFTAKTWSTVGATDWPNSVRSCVAVTTPDNTGKALWGWNLQAGGGARDMSLASTSEQFTPTVTTSS